MVAATTHKSHCNNASTRVHASAQVPGLCIRSGANQINYKKRLNLMLLILLLGLSPDFQYFRKDSAWIIQKTLKICTNQLPKMAQLIEVCSSVIDAIHASIDILGSVGMDSRIAQAMNVKFMGLRRRLIAVHDYLLEYANRVKAEKYSISESTREDLKTLLECVLSKVTMFKKILEKTIPSDMDKLEYRYIKDILRLRVEKGLDFILSEITEDTRLIVSHYALKVKLAHESQILNPKPIIQEKGQIKSLFLDQDTPIFVSGNSEEANIESSSSRLCLRDLRVTDHRAYKGLSERESRLLSLRDAYCWILATTSTTIFCQASDRQIKNAVAVLRELIYLLVTKQPSEINVISHGCSHVLARYETKWKKALHDSNAWNAISTILKEIMTDPSLQEVYLVVDALDECTWGRADILELSSQVPSNYPGINWIVSSRVNQQLLRSSTKDSTYPNEDSCGTQTAATSVEDGPSAFEATLKIENCDKESLYSQRTDLYSADQHISGIARILQQYLQLEPGDSSTPDFIQVVLEQCLKAFAIQLGHEVKSQESLRAMVFIRHYRK